MRPSIKQIANALNLSTAAVSKALNDYPDISLATKKIVKSYVKKVGYKANNQATYLRTQKTMTIGVILPDITNHFFLEILEGIMSQANKNNYTVILGHSNESEVEEKKLIYQFLQQKVDGILMSLAQDTSKFDHLEDVIENKTILVLFDKLARTINCSKVYVDDKKGGFKATRHLIKKGCTNIAHFRGDLNPQNSIDRYLGYREALSFHKIKFDPNKVLISRKGSIKEGYLLAKKLYESGIEIDGLFCVTDMVALGAIRFFKERKINVPNDICVIGFSKTMVGNFVNPSLSTVDQKASKMGKMAMKLFLSEEKILKTEKRLENQSLQLKTKLIKRESTSKVS
tara:strand:- start:4389 stop:5414 length:1026 start_codon:yes stop_codon:yes gene_type:complete